MLREQPAALNDLLGAQDGVRVPGGCDDCNAVQILTNRGGGIHQVQIHHAPDCPRHGGARR